MTRPRSRSRSRVTTVRWLHLAAVLALVLSTLLGSVLQVDPAIAKDRSRKDGRPAAARDRDARDGRIVNGTPAAQGEVPFAAYVQAVSGSFGWRCAGALVADLWVLTATSCSSDGGPIQVVLGSSDLQDLSARVVREVKTVVDGPGDMVSLLMLDRRVPLNVDPDIAAIGLPPATEQRRPVGEELVAAGWGFAGSPTNILMTGAFSVTDDATCAAEWNMNPSELAVRLCAGDSSPVSPRLCTDDLGAPLFQPDHSLLAGVATGVTHNVTGRCTGAFYPAMFARLESPDIQRFLADTLRTTDAVPPTVTITAPANGATVGPGFQIDATVAENESGVSVVEFWACADECTLLGKDSSAPYQQPNVTLQSGKSYELLAWAYDNAGNRGESVRVPITAGKESKKKKLKIACCEGDRMPYTDEFNVSGSTLFYHPDHEGGSITIQATIDLKSGMAPPTVTFPTLFGVPGGPGEQSYLGPNIWERTYVVPEGAQDSGPKQIAATTTTGGVTYEGSATLSVIADSDDPTVAITSPQQSPLIARVGSVAKLKATASDATSGIDAVEFYEGDPDDDDNEPFFTDESAPYKGGFEVTAGSHVITLVAWDLVGNYADSQTVTICGGSCDDPGPGPSPTPTPGPNPSPTPPPTSGDPDNWDTGPLVTSLPQIFSIETRYLTSSNTDPACTEDENGDPVAYDRSAWFHIRLAADASAYVSTAGSVATAGEDKPELDTVLMVLTREGGAWTEWACVDDVGYDMDGVPASVEAETAFFFHAGTDYYVMAATYKDLEDPSNVPAGTLEVRFSQR